MIRGLLGGAAAKRLARGVPVLELVALVQVVLLAGRHLGKLDAAERHRFTALVRRSRGRPSRLDDDDAAELRALVAKLEPRLFAGSAVNRLSPLPVPKRLLYGRRDNPARVAARGAKD